MNYPALVLRIRAMCFDSILFVLMFWIGFLLVWKLQITSTFLKIFIIATPLILFEPMWLWLTGSTVGQHIVGIKVAHKKTHKNLFIINAVARYLAKFLLGVYSLLTMIVTKRRQSFHDIISNSIVLFKNEASAPERYRIQENIKDSGNKPSILRRLMIIVIYMILVLAIFDWVAILVAPQSCWYDNICTDWQTIRVVIASVMVIFSLLVVVVLGCMSKLPGAYYKKR